MKKNSFVMLAEGSYIADELFETATYYIVHHILFSCYRSILVTFVL